MRRINLPLVLDTLFMGVCAFLLFFTAIRFYTKSAAAALLFGIAAGLIFGTLGYLYIGRKQNTKLLISRDEKNKKLLALHLSLSSDVYIRRLLRNLLGGDARIMGLRILCGEKVYFHDFKMHPLTEDDVAKIIKRKGDKKVLYCNSVSPEATVLSKNFSIEVRTLDGLYNDLKESGLLPEKYVFEDAPKTKFTDKIKKRFTRKLCAPLFRSGAALLVLSYFTFFPIYYVISGSILLILSAVALAVG